MSVTKRPRVLCVDDEPNIVDAITRQIKKYYEVHVATSGAEGLEKIHNHEPFAVVVSDMRMPGMDGTAFLKSVKAITPDTVRILLTGQSDLDSTIAAVNEGQIFRFLCKPCPREALLQALEAAVKQYDLVTGEKILLEKTLQGSVKVLADTLSIVHPAAFGIGARLKNHVSDMVAHMDGKESWVVEVAAMLSPIGYITLPPETVDSIYNGVELTEAEREMVDRIPKVTDKLLAHIPRLEEVRKILACRHKSYDGQGSPADDMTGEQIPFGARILRIAADFEELESKGLNSHSALDTMTGREGVYDQEILRKFIEVRGKSEGNTEVREVTVDGLSEGMVFDEDVLTRSGMMLIPRGQEVTVGVIARISNFARRSGIKQPVRVRIPEQTTTDKQEAAVTSGAPTGK